MNANNASSHAWPTRALLAIIIIGLGYTFYYVHERSSKAEKAKTFESTLLTVKHAIKEAAKSIPAAKDSYPRTFSVKRSGPLYDSAIFIMAQQRANLKISPKDALALQRIYSAYCLEKVEFESGIADIVKQSDGTRVVTIPAYPAQAKEMLSDLLDEVEEYYNHEAPANIIYTISTYFSGFADGNPQQLTIRAVYEPDVMPVPPNYDVIRNVTIIDPTTGEVTATGSAHFPVINIEQSGWPREFFPPLLSINKQANK